MNINERLKILREKEKLTTRAFGESINLSGGIITNMEKGRRNITERTIKDICRVYNVNSDWLTSGEGFMYNEAISSLNINDEVKQLARIYSFLNDNDKALVKSMISSLSEKIPPELLTSEEEEAADIDSQAELEIERKGEAYKEQLRLEANSQMSQVSPESNASATG